VHPRRLDEWVPKLSGTVIRPHQRPLSPREQGLLAEQAREWLHLAVIEPRPTQPINNNLVFVAKKTGGTRVCIDCTPVNLVTETHDWPLPKLAHIWPRLKGAKWFTRLDLKDAFFRFSIPVAFRHYTSFMSRGQQYQFRKMPFGVCDGPAVFQQFMDTHLALFEAYAVWFLDDILISAETEKELFDRTLRVKRKLEKIGCKINEAKSEYGKRALLFLGVWVFSGGLGPNKVALQEAAALPPPHNKKDMQSALGLVSYLRDFVPLTAHFTASLYPGQNTPLLQPDELVMQWGQLMSHIRSAATTLRHWRDGVPADLYVDASGRATGAVMVQDGRIVAVFSKKLSGPETRYSATDREHLALVQSAKRFRLLTHSDASAVTIHSDHAALLGRKIDDLTPRQARWLVIIRQWVPHLKHVKGINNPADFFSRWPVEIMGGAIKC
jgi:hypothetical protein